MKIFTAVAIFTAALLASGSILFSSDVKNRDEPAAVKKGATQVTIKGYSRKWKDVRKISPDRYGKPRKMRPVLNFRRNLPIVNRDKTPDPVVQKTFTGEKGPLERTLTTPSPGRGYEGMSYTSGGAGWPPDANGDIGPDHYVQAVNTSIGIYNKGSGALVSAASFNDFFGGAGFAATPCDDDNNGDPIVLYDRYAQRWFILDFAWAPSETDGSYFSIAVSGGSDPTGAWWQYAFRADSTLLNDYPKCGIWHDGIYIAANMYQFSGSYRYVKIWALKKPDIYNGVLIAQYVTDPGIYAYSILPGNAKGAVAPAPTDPNYMYALDAGEFGDGRADAIYTWKYAVDWTTPANTAWTGPSSMATAAFGVSDAGIPQLGAANTLDPLYDRLMYSAIYRKFPSYEAVYLCHAADSSGVRAMRWYEIRISAGISSIYQQGTYSPDANHRWMGSIAADKNGNIAMGYSVSSSSMYPAIRCCGRLSTDTPGVMGQGEATLIAGAGSQTGFNRWGDYSMLSIDPIDDETFWYTSEYLSTTGADWKTWIGAFKIAATPPPPDDINDAVDNTALSFTNSDDANWARVTDVYYYDGDSAGSGVITHGQSCSIETAIAPTSSQDVKFYWKVSSEDSYDYLTFYIDGVQIDRISGAVEWTQKVYNVAPGSHTLKWTYSKDYSVSSGSDTGWVDKLELL
ncbi:MAG: hypothetical protein NT166_06265 [Candidatus Aminicenantes bacterium]|nr:hypothetical protein [Candidatus Aminicenantes bacterium]